MEELSKWIQHYPIIIITMFIITLVAAIIGISLGWKKFYEDFLSKTISIPIWALILLFVFIFILLVPSTSGSPSDKIPKEFVSIVGQSFGRQQIVLDGKSFKRCSFDGTEVIFKGQDAFQLIDTNMKDFLLTYSENAAITLQVLTEIYKHPGFKEIVENTLQNVRDGKWPISTKITKMKEISK